MVVGTQPCSVFTGSYPKSPLPPSTAIESKSMTFEGFFRYMESKDCCVFNQAHASVYQDMDQPLSSYFISSSHNTYLMGDQIVGKSHLDAYVWYVPFVWKRSSPLNISPSC